VARAKKLLAEAGYPNGFELGLLCPNNRYVNDERICTALDRHVRQDRRAVKLTSMPRAQFFQKVDQFDVSMHLYGWGGAAVDPGFTLTRCIHSRDSRGRGEFNSGRYKDPSAGCADRGGRSGDGSGEAPRRDDRGAAEDPRGDLRAAAASPGHPLGDARQRAGPSTRPTTWSRPSGPASTEISGEEIPRKARKPCYAGLRGGRLQKDRRKLLGGVGILRRRVRVWSGWTIPAEPALLDIARADSLGHWSVVASASRKAWEDEPFASRFEGQGSPRPAATQASDGESRRASSPSIGSAWLPERAHTRGAFATARDVARERGRLRRRRLTLVGAIGQQERGTRIGAHGSWQGFSRSGALGVQLAARLRCRANRWRRRAASIAERRAGPASISTSALAPVLRGLDLSTRAAAARRCAPRRARDRALPLRRGSTAGSIPARREARSSLRASTSPPRRSGGNEYFASIGRGTRAAPGRGPTVASIPATARRSPGSIPARAPSSAEAGWRSRVAARLETA
jgi:hypothetical protein